MRVLVIIPTYNEVENVSKLIYALNKLEHKSLLDILIVDDNSPDGTGAAVKKLQKEYDNLFLMERSGKLGLGTAYLQGFKWALEKKYEVAVEMDADFSHHPDFLPLMISKIDNYDFIIGSRYVKGGAVENWPFIRKAISKGASLYSKLILGVDIKDFTGGFNLWKTSVLLAINLDSIKSNGYSFQVEMKYRAVKKNFSFLEVPIIFKERESGISKMSKKIFFEAVWKVIWLRLLVKNAKM